MQTQFSTKNLLRPDQVQRAKDEMKALERKLENRHIEDKAEVSRQLRRAKKDYETQVPTPPENPAEEDRMVKRAKHLVSEFTQGMPSQEEMRKAPPGAVDKHIAWERRNKTRIAEYKHIMLRLTAGSGDLSAANIEKHRPTASSLNMDNAHISGKAIYLPESTTGRGVTFSDEQLALLEKLSPEIRAQLASLDNATRAKVKDVVEGIGLTAEAGRAAKRERKPWTQEQKDALKARLAAGRAKKAAQKA